MLFGMMFLCAYGLFVFCYCLLHYLVIVVMCRCLGCSFGRWEYVGQMGILLGMLL